MRMDYGWAHARTFGPFGPLYRRYERAASKVSLLYHRSELEEATSPTTPTHSHTQMHAQSSAALTHTHVRTRTRKGTRARTRCARIGAHTVCVRIGERAASVSFPCAFLLLCSAQAWLAFGFDGPLPPPISDTPPEVNAAAPPTDRGATPRSEVRKAKGSAAGIRTEL